MAPPKVVESIERHAAYRHVHVWRVRYRGQNGLPYMRHVTAVDEMDAYMQIMGIKKEQTDA